MAKVLRVSKKNLLWPIVSKLVPKTLIAKKVCLVFRHSEWEPRPVPSKWHTGIVVSDSVANTRHTNPKCEHMLLGDLFILGRHVGHGTIVLELERE